MTLNYLKPKCSLDNGLVAITKDKLVYGMLDFLHKGRTAKVYMEHVGGVKLIESKVGRSIGSLPHGLGPAIVDSQPQVEVYDLDSGPQV